MSSNKFDALGSDDSEADEGINNHQQLEVLVVNLDSCTVTIEVDQACCELSIAWVADGHCPPASRVVIRVTGQELQCREFTCAIGRGVSSSTIGICSCCSNIIG